MNSSSQNPALPTWIFIATDLALIGAAAVIALLSPHPLATGAILWIVGCVIVGAIVGIVPLVARYERQKNEALDERQRALEALARTVSSTAEQISIATGGLNEIAELAHKNLRTAEQLPHKLQEKIAEFQAQLAANADAEKEELERELLALRTSESERLDSVSQRIAKSTADWTKLESATHQHLTAANEAVAKLALGTASAIGKAQAAAEQALMQARVEAARVLGEASGNAIRGLESARSTALADFDARLAALSASLVDRVLVELNTKLASSERAAASPRPPMAPTGSDAPASPVQEVDTTTSSHASGSAEASADAAPKRLRKSRREEADTNGSTANHAAPSTETVPSAPVESPAPTPLAPLASEEPLPVPADTIPEITPVAPATTEPFSTDTPSASKETETPLATKVPSEPPVSDKTSASDQAAASTTPAVDAAKSPRKRAAKKTEPDDEPGLGLDLGEVDGGSSASPNERTLTSDGATRLLVTAYIGIGNRLFIRGDGPGLSWEKGVPLQFVSIGKWRWETNDAAAPVQFRLFKNDDQECAALGAQSLDPGHQQEVTASF